MFPQNVKDDKKEPLLLPCAPNAPFSRLPEFYNTPTATNSKSRTKTSIHRAFALALLTVLLISGFLATCFLQHYYRLCRHDRNDHNASFSQAAASPKSIQDAAVPVVGVGLDEEAANGAILGKRDDTPKMGVWHKRRHIFDIAQMEDLPQATTTADASGAEPTREVLECFQVAPPVIAPVVTNEYEPCTVVLMEHKFGNSYGEPFVGSFTPPPCPFNRVTINFTTVSVGRQYDRLALMYLGDIEVWRTSTAEPTSAPGIRWEYHKDMTPFLSLWQQDQTVIFDLGNLINEKYTGWFNTTLTANFFMVAEDEDPGCEEDGRAGNGAGGTQDKPADLILPVNKMLGNTEGIDSRFTLPEDRALTTLTPFAVPANAVRAVLSVSANGQAEEEFWWSNVMSSTASTFPSTAGTLPSLSPWREVQVLIDGKVAGVYWPFPVIFTGGVSPGLHRPVVGIDAFELREKEIDITPWLGLLCDGMEHTIEFLIAGLDDSDDAVGDGTAGGGGIVVTQQVASNWVVTGKIFVWLDGDNPTGQTTGPAEPEIMFEDPIVEVKQMVQGDGEGRNETLTLMLGVQREVQVKSVITFPNGGMREMVWSQRIGMQNDGVLWDYGYKQVNDVVWSGVDWANSLDRGIEARAEGGDEEEEVVEEEVDGAVEAEQPQAQGGTSYFETSYKYPLYANSSYTVSPQGNLTIGAKVMQGLGWSTAGTPVFPTNLEPFTPHGQYPRALAPFYCPFVKDGGTGASSSMQPRGAFLSTERGGEAWFFQNGEGTVASGFGNTKQVLHFGALVPRVPVSIGGEVLPGGDAKVRVYMRDVEAVNGSLVYDREDIGVGDVVGMGMGVQL